MIISDFFSGVTDDQRFGFLNTPGSDPIKIDVELMNAIISWLKMCYKQGGYREEIQSECERVCELQEVREAASNLYKKGNAIAKIVYGRNILDLERYVLDYIKKTKKRDFIVGILKRI